MGGFGFVLKHFNILDIQEPHVKKVCDSPKINFSDKNDIDDIDL